MEKNIYSALKGVLLNTLHEASLYMDSVDFLNLIREVKEVIEYYERKE